MVVRGSAPGGLHETGPARPHRPAVLGLQSGYAQVQNEHIWSAGWVDIMQGGMAPQAAAEKAFKRVEEIFAKYPIVQA